MTFKIDGTDIMPYLTHGGLTPKLRRVEGKNSGIDLTGTEHYDHLANKLDWSVVFQALPDDDAAVVLSLIRPTTVSVTYTDPYTRTDVTGTYRTPEAAPNIMQFGSGGEIMFAGLAINLIEL